jgi:hypothetical protein
MKRLPRRNKRDGLTLTSGQCAVFQLGADMLSEYPDLDEEGVEKMVERLWSTHEKQILANWIQTFPGTRPPTFWRIGLGNLPGRPFVRESDGTVEDGRRFTEERRVEDLAFLIRHKLLTREEEKSILAEKKKREELNAELENDSR